MKKIIALVAIVMFIAASCNKTATPETPVPTPTPTPTPIQTQTPTPTPEPTPPPAGGQTPDPTPSPVPTPTPAPTPTPVPVPTPVPTPTPTPGPTTYTMAQVQAANSPIKCWAVISGSVYDLTEWISKHPGGSARIVGICGTDATTAFQGQHEGENKPENILATYKIGILKN